MAERKLKEGEQLRITCEIGGHGFEIGEIVTVLNPDNLDWYYFEGEDLWGVECYGNNGDEFWVYETEYVLANKKRRLWKRQHG